MKASLFWELTAGRHGVALTQKGVYNSSYFFSGDEENYQWKLEFSVNDERSDYNSVSIHLIASDADEIRIKHELQLRMYGDNDYEDYGIWDMDLVVSAKGVNTLKIHDKRFIDIPKFVPSEVYKQFCKSGKYPAIFCTLEIQSVQHKCNIKHHEEGTTALESLLDDPEFGDITLETSSRSFKVNKKVLSVQSPVFRAMFEHDMKEKIENTIMIPDVDAEVMQELLLFIYCGKVKCFDRAMELFRAADKYQVDALKLRCLEKLCDRITVKDAVEIYSLANACSDEKLIACATGFIVENIKKIIAEANFDSLQDISAMKKLLLGIVSEYVT
ncbi:hypothetical protein QAD02_010758 [Eretmocerus hayati]|uniref:Uncharacterized protein n=1 Tax=Eretmocerus hayati TaxID=131215 RepID=A0ACC2NV68_9HYME|nr:hypothetical protein QAD02_010758 [Eretmocerus hayati]